MSKDDGPRAGVTYEAISLPAGFRPDGVVTAGNCAQRRRRGRDHHERHPRRRFGLKPLARIVATGVSGLSPRSWDSARSRRPRGLAHAGMSIDDIDLVEINEAFAAQVMPSYQDLGIDLDRLNVNGGAIAVGHPFGMTGARIATTLVNSLHWHDKTLGLETMCVGGGQGMAMVLERLS